MSTSTIEQILNLNRGQSSPSVQSARLTVGRSVDRDIADATTSGSVRRVVDLAALQSIEYKRVNSNQAIEGKKQSVNRTAGRIVLEDLASKRVYFKMPVLSQMKLYSNVA